MTFRYRALRCALFAGAALCATPALAAEDDDAGPHTVSGIVVQGEAQTQADQPLSTRTLTAQDIATTVNATTVEDALKYLPNVFVRRRHIGDTQAPMTTRTSGVGSSARSLIYADGVLLSALIGNNNGTASPRWGMVSPEEIEKIEVLYGPFSAAYAGNSIGAVVNITTRTPQTFEADARTSAGVQGFKDYATKDSYPTWEAAGGLGDRLGPFAWRLSVSHLDTHGQPLSFMTALRPAAPGAAGIPVSGAIADRNRIGQAIAVLGAGGIEDQRQDNAKLKLEWEINPKLTAGYLVGYFGNRDDAHAETYLRDASGAPVYAGSLNIGGFTYAIPASTFASGVYHLEERHWMQALTLRGEPTANLRWEAIATAYDFGVDEQRTPTTALPAALNGGAGTILDLSGTGWRTLDAKAVWTPAGAHAVTLGVHTDRYELGNDRYNTADWISGARGALAASSRGKTETDAVFLEDQVRLSPQATLTLGVRQEHWRAFDGLNFSLAPASSVSQPSRSADRASPKAVLAWTPAPAWRVSASLGEAYRFPTVSELYQAVTVQTQVLVPNPNLAPERAVSSELSVERSWSKARLRLSGFTEDVSDALISQTALTPVGSTSFVQNVDHVRSRGVEAIAEAQDVLIRGLDFSASLTWVDSKIARDTALPAANGKRTPQVPRLRWTAVATWRANDKLTLTAAARYSDRVFGTIDNTDVIGHTFQGFEGYFVVDARATYRIDRHWSAAIGIDNLTDSDYFVFHPFPQRSALAELRYVY
ncbi:TonB-dependent receptor [Phenylobacterium sp.]|uniref:TonB-dependent receptor n=1 Tax=Phenylobacterium sp. TaxID=1871053 RepID=UPI00356145C1